MELVFNVGYVLAWWSNWHPPAYGAELDVCHSRCFVEVQSCRQLSGLSPKLLTLIALMACPKFHQYTLLSLAH